MASNEPTLLALPLELRNEIYNYLHHKKSFFARLPSLQPDRSKSKVQILIENAPCSNVLLISNQIRKADCFVDRRATMHCGELLGSNTPNGGQSINSINSVLECVKHLTLLTHGPSVTGYGGHRLLLAKAVMAKAPNMSSLRFVQETQYLSLEEYSDLKALFHKSLVIGYPRKYLKMPKAVANMDLKQYGHGYYLSDLGLPATTIIFDHDDDLFKYEVTGFQVLLYARHNAKTGHCRFDDVLADLEELAAGFSYSSYDMTKKLDKCRGVLKWTNTAPWLFPALPDGSGVI